VSVQESAGLFENVRAVGALPGVTCPPYLEQCPGSLRGADETEARRRASVIGSDLQELRRDGLAGSPDEIVDKIGRYAEVGTSRIYLQVLDLHDFDHLELIASGL